MTIDAVRRTITVSAPIEKTFQVFTGSMTTWWPPEHHIGKVDMAEAVLEPREGGRWYERGVDGSECQWGRVLAFDPPTRLVLAWHIGGDWQYDADPAHASEVEVGFVDLGDGRTRVDLEHREFERHGTGGGSVHQGVSASGGWTLSLERLAKATEAA
jgi:uncharacterized protein YndB with AHSA1/START domain